MRAWAVDKLAEAVWGDFRVRAGISGRLEDMVVIEEEQLCQSALRTINDTTGGSAHAILLIRCGRGYFAREPGEWDRTYMLDERRRFVAVLVVPS